MTSFVQWLKDQLPEGYAPGDSADPTLDLAYAVSIDQSLSPVASTVQELRWHMTLSGANHRTHAALNRAENIYRGGARGFARRQA